MRDWEDRVRGMEVEERSEWGGTMMVQISRWVRISLEKAERAVRAQGRVEVRRYPEPSLAPAPTSVGSKEASRRTRVGWVRYPLQPLLSPYSIFVQSCGWWLGGYRYAGSVYV